ncbi:MAG: hypothetical protein GF317_02590 [Candidatus Lokiarchaeota archaeon]|nr:hypothetical protein [Candidatus Lokiarchaeota archaeon]MBD3198794.1 hypothetical protein [Candidatus Lokiarchaeota archaeon]
MGFSKFFPDEEIVQRIRYLHFKIKHLEEALEKDDEVIDLDDLNFILEYTRILNINYGAVNHKEIIEELDITQTFHDPKSNKDLEIYDILFEIARVLWVLGKAYSNLSEGFEEKEQWQNAVVSMVESSKTFKAAAYFSAASAFQREKGETLSAENLELDSEETRIWAQGIAATKEESKNNIYFASKLYAGLSALSKRLFYLKEHNEKKKQQIRAQFHYDMGRACTLKARASIESSITPINQEKVMKLKQKADFYYNKAKEIWSYMLDKIKDISPDEREIINNNLTIVGENIKDNDVESLEYDEIKKIQDPEPIIIVPENLAPFVPKSTVYLTKFVPKDVNEIRFHRFKKKKLEKKIPYNKKEKLLDKKAGILRTINELKVLKDDNEVDLEKFAELMEKYSVKLKMIDTALQKIAKS